ncbi:uncharacterized protein B0T23DRAFT_69799 [Neurospora hispaniola]|uniref:Secreted protein n=1 Tax=Neurospora hispaniola TaxID=588809 RepID=A0AAJ0IC64_9PEZI|nr:hypothetical protein B0T23DRAFT_69799 [Neurospora hispaniola]
MMMMLNTWGTGSVSSFLLAQLALMFRFIQPAMAGAKASLTEIDEPAVVGLGNERCLLLTLRTWKRFHLTSLNLSRYDDKVAVYWRPPHPVSREISHKRYPCTKGTVPGCIHFSAAASRIGKFFSKNRYGRV